LAGRTEDDKYHAYSKDASAMMKPVSNKRTVAQKGSYMVEYSFVIITFVFVLFGIVEFGRIVSAYNVLAGATREGTRFAIVHGSKGSPVATATDIETEVKRWCLLMDSSSVVVTTTWPDNNSNAPGKRVKVQSSYTIVPFVRFVGASITLTANSQMYISN
jgi:Flp pilus assembly protein TadG